MVDFYKDWYDNLIAHSNEKGLLVEKISDLLKGKTHKNCLEIGLGTSAYFSERLQNFFQEYTIIERENFEGVLPEKVIFIKGDVETEMFDKKFDVIIASHVVYYFKDLKTTGQKIYDLLNEGGRAYFVVNGKESDYGPIKNAFAEMINEPYTFTYDKLRLCLVEYKTREYTTQASLSFASPEDLYEAMRLSFDLYPKEYDENNEKVIDWLSKNVVGDKFFIDQKIIEVIK